MKRFFFASLSTIIFMTGCDSLGTGDTDLLTLKSESIIEVESNEKVVNILFDAAGTWSAESDSDWAVPEQRYGDAGDDITLEVTVYANETGSAREAVIALSCGEQTVEITIVQSADDEGGEVIDPQGEYLVSSIRETDQDGYQMTFSYEYDFIESFGKYMPVKETFDMEGDVTDVEYQYGSGYIDRIVIYEGVEDYRYRLLLDEENRITDIKDEEGSYGYTVEYNSDGQILSEESGNLDEDYYYSSKYEWQNGNLAKSVRRDFEQGHDINGDGQTDDNNIRDVTEEYDYKYTEYPNNTNLDLNARLCGGYNSSLMSDGPALFGITGKRSENLGYGPFYGMSEPWHDIYRDRVTDGQTDRVTNYDIEIGNDEAEALFEFNDEGYPVKVTITAPKYKTEIIRTYTYDINYEGRTEVLGDGTVYYFDFEREMTETTGKTFQDGQVSRMYEITYTK